ncbi:MATE family efflux transporter [Floccifex sp.]|uniref:MATE family efflux transporter n=1 Tax=Floccifex sp. TaxID=2815810 RepID=UPI003EFF4C65
MMHWLEQNLNYKQKIKLVLSLSLPTILAQISTIIMEYIDAAMVGRLGANDSASIGLVSSTIWLLSGIANFLSAGFTVQMAQCIGAKQYTKARNILKQGFLICLLLSILLSGFGLYLSPRIPVWLQGSKDIVENASVYLKIYSFFLPFSCINTLLTLSLQASGNMKIPSFFNVGMCVLNIILNFYFIFPFGLNLRIKGAALATGISIIVCMLCLLFYINSKSETLSFLKKEPFYWDTKSLHHAFSIGFPVCMESALTSFSYIAFTAIVAPLGTLAIAANSFAITAESLCYMPGYGIQSAASMIIGQTIGAQKETLTKEFSWLITFLGMIIMTCSGILLYIFAPFMISLLTIDTSIQQLAIQILRIEAFAEPLYGASIVCAGVFRGAGDTKVSTLLNFVSMWCLRIPLAYILSLFYGLQGCWLAMCLELCFRGCIFLFRLFQNKWIHSYI